MSKGKNNGPDPDKDPANPEKKGCDWIRAYRFVDWSSFEVDFLLALLFEEEGTIKVTVAGIA